MSNIEFTKEQKETIFMLHQQGLSTKRIAEIMKDKLKKDKKK